MQYFGGWYNILLKLIIGCICDVGIVFGGELGIVGLIGR